MKVAILNAFPRVDRQRYKGTVLTGLADRAGLVEDVVMVYAFTDVRDLAKKARRQYGTREGLSRLRSGAAGVAHPVVGAATALIGGAGNDSDSPGDPLAPPVKDGSTKEPSRAIPKLAMDLGFGVKMYDRYSEEDCVELMKTFRPTVILNLGGQYVPKALFAVPPAGVVGGHYASLPEIRGADTVRWTVLLDRPLVVSHQVLAPAFDTGDVVRRAAVPVRRGDTILDLRAKCQAEHATGCLALVDTLGSGELSREPQHPDGGSYFRPMGRYLRERTDEILASATYSHYSP
jgi:hypothetical protein